MQNASETLSKVWTLKYAPQKVDDLILSDSNRSFFSSLKELNNNLLFLGKPGCGKTTLARILAKKFAPNSYLYINASEENGIDVIRNKIRNFVSTASFDGNIKIVILDESDGITLAAQQALRGLMEEYIDDVKFIITGNFKHKVIEAIQSRCQSFEFETSPIFILKRIFFILDNEEIVYSPDDKKALASIVKAYAPDIRKTINELQKHCTTGTFVSDLKKDETISSQIVEMFKNKAKVFDVRKFVLGNEKEFNGDYHNLMRNLFDIYVSQGDTAKVLQIVEAMYRHSIVVDPEVNFTGLLINLSK